MLARPIKIDFRVNENEYFQLKRTARKAGFTVAAFCRKCCLSDEKVLIIDAEAVRDLYGEVNHIGNNINQIARIANTDKNIDPAFTVRIETMMLEIKKRIDQKIGGI